MGRALRNKGVIWGIIAGAITLLVLFLGIAVWPEQVILYNVLIFALITFSATLILAFNIPGLFGYLGFNSMLKPLLVLFIFSYLTYALGFALYEHQLNPDIQEIKREISRKQLKKYENQLSSEQVEQAKKMIEDDDSYQKGFSITGFLLNFVLYFAIIGLPASILSAALANKGFHNEEPIARSK
jgi:hypothetical protein